MADPSASRLQKKTQSAFRITSLGFIGLFSVKNNGKLSCRYILLIIGLVVRAIHLEVSNNLTPDSAINCIRGLISRRQNHNKFGSDCAQSFVCFNSNLQSIIVENREPN